MYIFIKIFTIHVCIIFFFCILTIADVCNIFVICEYVLNIIIIRPLNVLNVASEAQKINFMVLYTAFFVLDHYLIMFHRNMSIR